MSNDQDSSERTTSFSLPKLRRSKRSDVVDHIMANAGVLHTLRSLMCRLATALTF